MLKADVLWLPLSVCHFVVFSLPPCLRASESIKLTPEFHGDTHTAHPMDDLTLSDWLAGKDTQTYTHTHTHTIQSVT